MRKFLFILIFILPKFSGAQSVFSTYADDLHPHYFFLKDSTRTDTLKRKKMSAPKKATIMSACLPGLGQVYNHKWWKAPIIYAGFGGLAYGFAWNEKYFKLYRNSLRDRYDNDPSTIDPFLSRYTDDDLVTLKNYYQHYRDLCVIGMAAVYTLQVIDATVDAHLRTFDVSDNLSLQVNPAMYPSGNGFTGMIGLRLYYR